MQGLPAQFIGRDYIYRAGLPIWHVDHAQVSTAAGLPDGNTRALPARTILDASAKDILDLGLVYAVNVDVWLIRLRIEVVAGNHTSRLSEIRRTLNVLTANPVASTKPSGTESDFVSKRGVSPFRCLAAPDLFDLRVAVRLGAPAVDDVVFFDLQ